MTSQAFGRVCCCGCVPAIVNQDDLHKIHSLYTNKSNAYIIDLGFYIHIYICTYFIMRIHAYWRTHLLLFTCVHTVSITVHIGCTLISPTVKWYGSLSLIVQFLALALIFTFHDCIYRRGYTQRDCKGTTVDGWNPAPPRMMIIPLFIGFWPSQVVQDFVRQQYFKTFPPKKTDLHPRIKWHIPCLGSFLFCAQVPHPWCSWSFCVYFFWVAWCAKNAWNCIITTVFGGVIFKWFATPKNNKTQVARQSWVT